MSDHSTLPWELKRDDSGAIAIIAATGHFITFAFPNGDADDAANAASIVRAVNAHDELVAALRELLNADRQTYNAITMDRDTCDAAINRQIAAEKAAAALLAKLEATP
jgi:hypothetical protein